jgi:uncharacterized protein (TIGR02147 family)
MKEQVAVQKLLRRKLAELQSRNPAFSVRAFAGRLGLQPAAANEILKGDRRISRKMAERLAEKLHLDPSERAEFLGQFPVRVRRKGRLSQAADPRADALSAQKEVLRLTSDQFAVISDWVHFAILNLVKTADADSNSAWMAERLAISETRIDGAIERLVRLGLMEKNADGKWTRTYARINTPDDVFNISIQKSHLTDMDLARESILRDPVESRDFSSMTMAISPALLPRAKEILRNAQDEVMALAAEKPATEVYRLTNYLFPLTRLSNQSKTKSPKKEK